MAAVKSHDTLILRLMPSGEASEERFQATLYGHTLSLEGGPFRRPHNIAADEVQAVQQEYRRYVEQTHRLEKSGVAGTIPPMRKLLALGRRVAEILPEQTRVGLRQALLYAQREDRYLRVVILFDPSARLLLRVPWELLTLPSLPPAPGIEELADFYFLRGDVSLVREVEGIGRVLSDGFGPVLDAQVFVAAPRGVESIRTELICSALEGRVSLDDTTWYDGPGTLEVLEQRLTRDNPSILHLVCHGTVTPIGHGERHDLLFVAARDNVARRVNIFDLAPLVTHRHSLRLIVLHACHGGAHQSDHVRGVSESIAVGLVCAGVPWVVALQGEASQEAMEAFIARFYEALQNGVSVDWAVASGRVAMRSIGTAEWSLPVLYGGSAQPEERTWYSGLADVVEHGFREPGTIRAFRGTTTAAALLLLGAALVQLMLLPPMPPLAVQVEAIQAAGVWALWGMVAPGIVASRYGGVRRRNLVGEVRRRALIAQWTGAYLGYSLAGVIGWSMLALLYFLGIAGWLPVVAQVSMLLVATVTVMLWSTLTSYVGARSQVASAAALAKDHPDLYDWSSQWVLVVAVLALLAAPPVLLPMLLARAPMVLEPAAGAVMYAGLLLWITRQDHGGRTRPLRVLRPRNNDRTL